MKTLTISRQFFCYAANIFDHCDGLPDFITGAFCISVVQHGERTHICSLDPSSRVAGLRNTFVCHERDAEKMRAWVDTNEGAEWEYGTHSALSSVDYYGFIEHNPASPRMTDLLDFSDDFDLPDDFDPDSDRLPDDVNESLWDEAVEYYSGNCHEPACVAYETGAVLCEVAP